MAKKIKSRSGMEAFLEGYREEEEKIKREQERKTAVGCLDILEKFCSSPILTITKIQEMWSPGKYTNDEVKMMINELKRRGLIYVVSDWNGSEAISRKD